MNDAPIDQAGLAAKTRIRVLILEDNPSDADLMVDELRRAGLDPQWKRVEIEQEFAARLTPELDLILSDYGLPQFNGLRALQLVRSRGLDVPFILVSGSIGEDIAVTAMREGADDYLLKDRMARLGPAALQAIEKKKLRDEGRRAAGALARVNRVLAVLSGTNALIVRVRDRDELFREACRIAVEHGKFGMAWIGLFDPDTLEVTPAAWAGPGADQFLGGVKSSIRVDLPTGQGMLAQAIRTREPAFDNDILKSPGAGGARRTEAIRLGYRSFITLPLVIERNVVGNLSLFAKEPNFFNEEELKLLTELAGDISYALEHIAGQQKIEKLSRIRAVSSEINAAIVRVRDRKALLEETCRIATEYGKFELVWVGLLDQEQQQVRLVAWTGFSPETAQAVNWASINTPHVILGEVIRTRRPAVRNDIEAEVPAGILRKEAAKKGYRSTVCLPFVVDDKVVAAIILFGAERGYFDEDELALLNELAADVSFALQSIVQQEKVEYLSYYDSLSGLPNRTLFMDRAGQQMRSRGGEPLMVALVLLNLERFRNINESFGRHGGDELLKLVARRLESAFNGKDYLARIGADGFGVVMRGIRDAAAVVHVVESQILGCFREPYKLNDTELRVAAKAGIAVFPADGANADTLFKNAEAALKKARDSGERYLFYAADMNARAAHALSLETRLRKAVEAQQFVLHYQPKVDLASGRISGLEALIRWNDPETGLVPPMQFIPLLEETGMILDAGRWAIHKALENYREWHKEGLQPPRIAVNVSLIQLRQKDFVDVVRNAISAYAAGDHGLDLEITESLIMEDIEGNIAKLRAIRDIGVRIAIDDFGTGYSSLGYLAKLPVNALKIDRSFIITMAKTPDSMTIVSTIISLAHALNLTVVAEGVDAEEQRTLLRLLKCDEMQGYLFSKPLPADALVALLRGSAPVK